MNKKILLILLIVFCTLTITGCGNTNSNNDLDNEKGENKENKTKQMEKVEVNSILATSENYAVVLGKDGITYVINDNGIVEGNIPSTAALAYQINDNGYVFQIGESYKKIYDKSGKELIVSKSSESYYYGISPDNYLIRSVKQDDFENGTSYIYQVVDIDGKVIKDNIRKDLESDANGSFSVTYLGENIYFIKDKDTPYLYNIKTGKYNKIEYGDVEYSSCTPKNSNNNWIKCYSKINQDSIRINNAIIKEDLNVLKVDTYDIAIDNNYYYKDKDKSIYSYNGEKIKELTSGDGLKSVLFKDNKYYVSSGTYYYYVMNKSFEQEKEPIKLGKSVKAVTKYGIIVNKDSSTRQSALYDFDGKLIKDFNDLYLYDPQDFIAKTFIDGKDNNTLPVNLKTAETITIYK